MSPTASPSPSPTPSTTPSASPSPSPSPSPSNTPSPSPIPPFQYNVQDRLVVLSFPSSYANSTGVAVCTAGQVCKIQFTASYSLVSSFAIGLYDLAFITNYAAALSSNRTFADIASPLVSLISSFACSSANQAGQACFFAWSIGIMPPVTPGQYVIAIVGTSANQSVSALDFGIITIAPAALITMSSPPSLPSSAKNVSAAKAFARQSSPTLLVGSTVTVTLTSTADVSAMRVDVFNASALASSALSFYLGPLAVGLTPAYTVTSLNNPTPGATLSLSWIVPSPYPLGQGMSVVVITSLGPTPSFTIVPVIIEIPVACTTAGCSELYNGTYMGTFESQVDLTNAIKTATCIPSAASATYAVNLTLLHTPATLHLDLVFLAIQPSPYKLVRKGSAYHCFVGGFMDSALTCNAALDEVPDCLLVTFNNDEYDSITLTTTIDSAHLKCGYGFDQNFCTPVRSFLSIILYPGGIPPPPKSDVGSFGSTIFGILVTVIFFAGWLVAGLYHFYRRFFLNLHDDHPLSHALSGNYDKVRRAINSMSTSSPPSSASTSAAAPRSAPDLPHSHPQAQYSQYSSRTGPSPPPQFSGYTGYSRVATPPASPSASRSRTAAAAPVPAEPPEESLI